MDQVSNPGDAPVAKRAPSVNQHALLPAESPLDMPSQPLGLGRADSKTRDRMTWPRAALLLQTVMAVAVFAQLLYQVLSVVQLTTLQAVFLVLCTLCFGWIALGTSSAVLGFLAMLWPRKAQDVAPPVAPDVCTA